MSRPVFRVKQAHPGFRHLVAGVLMFLGLAHLLPVRSAEPAADSAASIKPEVGPQPAWVVTNQFTRLPLTAFQPGEEQRLLLSERQMNVEEGATFYHVARQVLTIAGVQNGSTISIDFDPSYEILTLHSIRVWRGTNVTDHLDLDRISTMRREQDLDRYLFNGQSSAVLVLKDIRVRDIVEYSYSVRGKNTVFAGKYFGTVPVQLSVPANRLITRLLWPSGRKLQIRNHGCSVNVQKRQTNEVTEYVWDFRNVPARQPEANLPAWIDPTAWVQLSEFQTWAEVAGWAVELFNGDAPLPPELMQKIGVWKRMGTPEKQVLAALHFVQDEIRYFGVEMGAGSHKPSVPAEVFRRRFGDCKDKTLLFVRIIRALGFEAYPVLVNTELRKGIATFHPTPAAFDHVITLVRLPTSAHWVDPTAGYQRGPLSAHYLPDYGQGLLVMSRVQALTNIPATTTDSQTIANEKYEVGRPGTQSRLKVTTVATGRDAEDLRALFASTPRDKVEKAYLEFYAKAHAGISRTGPIVLTDDEAANRFTFTEAYVIPDLWSRPDRNRPLAAEFFPYHVAACLKKPTDSTRKLPLGLLHPQHQVVRTEIQWPATYSLAPQTVDVSSSAFRFHKTLRSQGDRTLLEYEYQSLGDSVTTDNYQRHAQEVSRALDNLGLAITWQ